MIALKEEYKMRIHSNDNVELDIATGQKKALRDIKEGEKIIKYGEAIGHATCDIKEGESVHMHNVKSDIGFEVEFNVKPEGVERTEFKERTFMGYLRENGQVGIRNELWIIPGVGCINSVARRLAAATGAKALCHPWGCSQVGDNLERTGRLLASLARHPNAGGVLVLGLGCENNTLDSMKERLKDAGDRVRFLNIQDCEDEIAEGTKILSELAENMKKDKRVELPISMLKIGLKCGGSDAYSGVCANPLVGRVAEKLYGMGSICLMSEVPEMFGGEHLLLKRTISRKLFDKAENMMKRFRSYYAKHGEGVADNPSPGNHAGGITTLEEKSLGCIQKGGDVPVVNVLEMGEGSSAQSGLQLVDGPGNDLISVTNLAASGAHMVLFTTGRGTPFAGPIPTVKIASNSRIAGLKPHWIDFDSSPCIENGFEKATDELLDLVVAIAEGKNTKAEDHGYYDISLFVDGAIL